MTDPKDIRTETWMKNVPEWLGEVLAQLTENRIANQEILRRLTEREVHLERLESSLNDQANVLVDRNEALTKTVADLKQFADELFGPTSAIAQINQKLDKMRDESDKRLTELELAQEETDDHLRELKESFEQRLQEFSNRLDSLGI